MFSAGGTTPRTKTQKIIWWATFTMVALFIAWVVIKNRHNF
jgi:hypothetical protein